MTAAQASPRAIFLALLAHLAGKLRKAAKSPEDPDTVHDLRVAIRRFGQALRIFPDLFEHGDGKRIKRQLKKMMRALGTVRNLDLAPDLLQAAKASSTQALLEELQNQRRAAQKHLESLLKSWRKQNLLGDWKSRMHGNAGGRQLFQNARLELPGLAGEFFRAGDYAARRKVPYRLMHRCRLLGKRLRYSMEIFDLHSVKEFAPRFKVLKQLQDQLGALNDCVTVIEVISGNASAKNKLRLLRARQEKTFRDFWKRKFDSKTQDGWLRALVPAGPPKAA